MPEMQQRSQAGILHTTTTTHSSPSSSASKEKDREDADPHVPSSIPPWVHVNNNTSNDDENPLLVAPSASKPNTRHYKPPPAHYKPGRKWDHLRSAEPPLLSAPIADHQARWRSFMQSGPNPQEQSAAGARVVDAAWVEENMPWLGPDGWEDDEEKGAAMGVLTAKGLMYRGKWLISPERQERTVRLFWRLLLKNPFVPLVFRITVLAFSASALGIGAAIYTAVQHVNHDNDPNNQCASRASTYMAICVGCVALPYLFYVTWDEYMSKPLGLRSVPAKILLLLCDLYFVVFSSSNLSIALDTVWDRRWACYDEEFSIVGDRTKPVQATCPNNPSICNKQKALSGVLFVSLVAWCVTFSISVLRVVEKLRPD